MRSTHQRFFSASASVGLIAALGITSATSISEEAVAAQEAESPPYIFMTGVVRDFRERTVPGGHPDFEVTPDHGSGHYAGSMEHFIGPGFKPAFNSGGRKIISEYHDSSGRPIAPHMYNKRFIPGMGESPNATSIILTDSSGVDAFQIDWLLTNFNDDGTSTWMYRVSELETGKDLSHWDLALPESVEVMPGTTPGYELGVDGSTGFYGIKWDVTDEFSVQDFTIVLDQQYLGLDNPAGVLAKGGHTADVGDMFGPSEYLSTTGSPFNTEPMLVDDPTLEDEEGQTGAADNGGVESGVSFFQWYRDYPHLNWSAPLTIQLNKQADGSYVFDSATDEHYSQLGGFFPIDNQMFGNSGGDPDHNYHFTFEMHAEFTYDEAGDQYFKFSGDDDVWVFIDGKLAIDMGGVHSSIEQYADLSRFGLTDGETYMFSFFFAERKRTQSNFRMETNMELESLSLPTIAAAFD